METKKTKINYKGTLIEVNRENKNNEILMNKLISKSLYSIFSIELVNYLNRLINGDNLYEVYVNNSNREDKPEELISYVFKPEEACSSTRARDIESVYINKLVNDVGQVDLDLLDQNRNPKYPTCVHNFEEIDYVPIYTYIHPTLAKNQGNTVHIMHLGLLFQLLTRIKGLPEFNTQAVMSILNTAVKSQQIGITIETVNKSQYEELVEQNLKLQGKLKKKQDKIDKLIDLVKEQRETISTQTNELREARKQIDIQTSIILQTAGNLDEARNDINDLLCLNKVNNRNVEDLLKVSKEMKHELKKQSARNSSTETHVPKLVMYLSDSVPGGRYEKLEPEGSIWIGTKCQVFRHGIETELPNDAEILFQSDVVGIDILKYILDSTSDIYIDSFYRQILIYDTDVETFIDRVRNLINEKDNHEAIVNLKPVTDRIKKREEQKRILAEKEQRTSRFVRLRQTIIDNGKFYIHIYGQNFRLWSRDDNNQWTEELDAQKWFYIRRVVNGHRQHEHITHTTLLHSTFSDHE